jgi:transcriptional regulator GlxA family with amidase domain
MVSTSGSKIVRKLPRESHAEAAMRLIALFCTESTLRLRRLAMELNLSPFYLSRLLSEATRRSFTSNLNTFRVLRAIALLSTGQFSVKEVAVSVGYQWTSQLDRSFAHLLQLKPGDIRRTVPHTY